MYRWENPVLNKSPICLFGHVTAICLTNNYIITNLVKWDIFCLSILNLSYGLEWLVQDTKIIWYENINHIYNLNSTEI